MAAYRWFYDSRHLQADCQEPDHLRNATDVDISVRSFRINGGLTTLISKLLFGRETEKTEQHEAAGRPHVKSCGGGHICGVKWRRPIALLK